MRQRQRARADEMRAVQDEIDVDYSRRVAGCSPTPEARFDRKQRGEERLRIEIGIAGNDCV